MIGATANGKGTTRGDPAYVYVLRCARGILYTGYTVDLERRLRAHATSRGARFTRANPPEAVVGVWSFARATAARRAEARLKRLPRPEKLRVLARCAAGEQFAESIAFEGAERPLTADATVHRGGWPRTPTSSGDGADRMDEASSVIECDGGEADVTGPDRVRTS